MAQVPKPFMRGNQTLHVAAPRAVGCQRTAGQHHLQDVQQLLGDLEVGLIAGMMERNKDLVRQTPRIAGRPTGSALASGNFLGLVHCLVCRRAHWPSTVSVSALAFSSR